MPATPPPAGERKPEVPFRGDCPYCNHDTKWTTVALTIPLADGNPDEGEATSLEQHVMYRCDLCHRCIMVRTVTNYYDENDVLKVETFPAAVPRIDVNITGKPRDIFEEAQKCYGAGAWNAVGTMVRRCIEQVCNDYGTQGRDLYNKLVDLPNKTIVSPELIEMAHQLRIIGRDGAHANDSNASNVFVDLDRDDADHAIEFCATFLDLTLGAQARLAAAKNKRPK